MTFNYKLFPNEVDVPVKDGYTQVIIDYSNTGEIGRIQIYSDAVDGFVEVDLFEFEKKFGARFAQYQQFVYEHHKSNQLSKVLFGT